MNVNFVKIENTKSSIAKSFNISIGAIRSIINGESWKHVTLDN